MVERVRADWQKDFQTKLNNEARKREQSERAATIAQGHTATIVSGVENRIDRFSGLAAGTVFGLLCIFVSIGGLLTLFLSTEWLQWTQSNMVLAIAVWCCMLVYLGCSLLALCTRRFQFFNVFRKLKNCFVGLLRQWFLPGV